jgi:hypothetical protein
MKALTGTSIQQVCQVRFIFDQRHLEHLRLLGFFPGAGPAHYSNSLAAALAMRMLLCK